MFGIFKKLFSSDGHDSQFERDAVMAISKGNLDLQIAIAAHTNWKLRLISYLDGDSSEELSAETICFDDRCDLGKWIHSAGQASLGRFPGFTALLGHHKMFHYAASNVVALSKAGKETEARKMLSGQFESFSRSVVSGLEELQEIQTRRSKSVATK